MGQKQKAISTTHGYKVTTPVQVEDASLPPCHQLYLFKVGNYIRTLLRCEATCQTPMPSWSAAGPHLPCLTEGVYHYSIMASGSLPLPTSSNPSQAPLPKRHIRIAEDVGWTDTQLVGITET
jgi:hypothetical protein